MSLPLNPTLTPIGDTLRLRPALPALAVLALAAVLAVLGMTRPNTPAPHADVSVLPATLGSWVLLASDRTDPAHMALDTQSLGSLDLDSYTQRAYQDVHTGRVVTLLLEYRTLGRGAFNHRPEACYPASGYTLSDRRTVPVTYNGHPGTAVSINADGRFTDAQGEHPSHQVLLYWFATGGRIVSNFWAQQVEMAFGKLHPETNGWAFARLVSECPPGDEKNALAAEQDFTAQASPAIVQALSAPGPAR